MNILVPPQDPLYGSLNIGVQMQGVHDLNTLVRLRNVP